jgi:phage-related protein
MAGSYSAGTATLDVIPSLKNFHSKIRSELKSISPDIKIGVTPDMKGFQQKVKSGIGKPPTVQIKTEVNKADLAKAESAVVASEKRMVAARDQARDSSAKVDIAEKQLAETRAKSSANASQIAASELKLAQAKRASASASNDARNAEAALSAARSNVRDAKVKVATDVDTAGASAKLREFAAAAGARYRVSLGVDADTTRARVALEAFGVYAKRTASVTGNVSLDTGAAVAKLTALSAVGAGAGFAISGAMGLAGGALVALPGLAAAALGPIATLAVGLNGVGDAIKAYGDADARAGSNAIALAQQHTQSARAIASASLQIGQAKIAEQRAFQDAGWAAVAADRQILDAETQLTSAERTSLRAQQDLTQARLDAADAMKQLNFQVRGGILSEREAVLNLADAQVALDAAVASGADGAGLERVTIAYEQQKLALEEVQAQNAKLSADQAKATAVGVEGSAQVVAAQDSVRQASEGVASAQQGVADAQTAAAQQQIQSQRSIVDAQTAVIAAQRQYTQAIEDSVAVSGPMTSAAQKISDAMAQLSPNARSFVTALQGLRPEFDAMKHFVQDTLFAGMGPAFTNFAHTILPAMATNLGVVAGAMNQLAVQAMAFLSSAPVMEQIRQIFAGIAQVIVASGPVIQAFVQLFLQLATAAMPGIVLLVQAVGTLATAIMSALQPLINTGVLQAAIAGIAQLIVSLAPILATVVAVAVQLMAALGPSLVAVVNSLLPVIQMLGQLLISMAPIVGQVAQAIATALVPWVAALMPVISALLPVLSTLINAYLTAVVPWVQVLSGVFMALLPTVQMVADVLASLVPVIMPLINVIGGVLIGLIQQLAPIFATILTTLVPFITQLATQLAPILQQVGTILSTVLLSALNALMPIFPVLTQIITTLLGALAPIIPVVLQIVGSLLTALMPILPTLANLFLTLIQAVLPILPPLLNLTMTLLPFLVTIINQLMPIIQFLANILVGVLAVVLETVVVPAINLVIGTIKTLIDIFRFLWDITISPIIDALGSAATWLWEQAIKPAFDAIRDGCGRIGDAFKTMGDAVGGIWDGLKKVVHDGIQAVVDIVYNYGIRTLVNAVVQYIPGVDELPELKIPAFAGGGVVPGYGPGRDTVHAMLSPGEAILVPEAVKMLGIGTIMAWNQQAMARSGRSSGSTSGFADGGVVVPAPTAVPAVAAAPVTIDVSALAALGDVATAVTAAVGALAVQITTLVTQVVAQWAQVTAATVLAADTITARQTALGVFYDLSWQAMQASVWTSVNGQNTAFATLQNGMGSLRAAMGATADWAVTQYARIQGAAADPIRWVLQFPFNAGLIAAWNSLDSTFAFGKHVDPVAIGFATGGYVSGPGTGTSDSIAARLSRGEYVMPADVTKRTLPFLEALRAGQAEALQATGYASGGVVADTGSGLNATIFRAQQWAKAQDGKPYIYGGVGPAGFDCSGYMSGITNVLRGEANPNRRVGVAAGAPWPGFVHGLSSAFAMGSSVSHTAGTLGGVNVESTGNHVRFGGDAHGADDRQFPVQSSLPTVGGQFVPGGGPGLDPVAVMTAAFADALNMITSVADMWPGNLAAFQGAGVARAGMSSLTKVGVDKLSALAAASTGAAGSPEVVAAVRAVAATFGWGDGAQWQALSSLISGESGWNPEAANPITSARGLGQKMTSIHGPIEPTIAGQALWMLNYIKGMYRDPITAFAKWSARSPHWYDAGGVATGRGFLPKATPAPERVLSPVQTRQFDRLVAYISSGSGIAPAGGDARAGGVTIHQTVNPAPGQDERAIAADSSRRIAFSLRTT